MKLILRAILATTVLSCVAGSHAAETGWDVRLAGKFSGRMREIEKELNELAPQLDSLPVIPIDDQGGTGGYAANYTSASPEPKTRHAVEIRWAAPASVDLLALVPTRRYNAKGLDAQYGTPDTFSVEWIGENGEPLGTVAREKGVSSHPVRRGHPFVYQLPAPVVAAGVRISAESLLPDSEDAGVFVHAWAEVFAFEGGKNVARNAKVTSVGGSIPSALWHWNTKYLVDGQTPLGLPEVPEEHGNVGWISEGRTNANETATLSVDLGEMVEVDAVRFLPAKRPTSDLPSGFGFPRKLKIFVSETGEPGEKGAWVEAAAPDLHNPGHNPLEVSFSPVRGRHVRVEALELWKAFESYPAFFALSEVEVLSGAENRGAGKTVRCSDTMGIIGAGGRYWSSAALSDGFGPEGRLVSTRDWMLLLDKRLGLETRIHDLHEESARLVAGWRRAGLIGTAALVLAGAFLIVFLPIRFRIQANRELLQVRERIAGDLHDEVGSNLGSIQMFADLAEGRSGPSDELKRIQRIAAETVSAVRDIVWLLRPGGDHRIATVEHLRETSSIMLETLDWKFTANEDAWKVELPEEETRHLFLFFREALHNIMRHAKAKKVEIRVEKTDGQFRLAIKDDGVGISVEKLERPSTLRALRQRTEALGAELRVESTPEQGTRLELTVPLDRKRPRKKPVAVVSSGVS